MQNAFPSIRTRVIPKVLCLLLLISAALPAQLESESSQGDVPYVPTPPEVVQAMLDLGGAKKTDVVYDLGCGDGRIVVMAAKKYGARGVGVDINPERIKEAEENARKEGVTGRARFVQQDLFKADFHEATLVTLYLLPEVNLRLRPRLLKDLKVGTRIVSHSFDMDEWKPDKTVDINGRTLYLWTVTEKAKAAYASAAAAAAYD